MARLRRLIVPDSAMHVYARGNNKQKMFHSDKDKSVYYRYLKEFREQNLINIFHYCIMNNHVHLLVWIAQGSALGRFIQQVNCSYIHYYRREYDYSGHLLQGRYKSNVIQDDAHLLQCGKYIELNPVRAEMVKAPEEYKFSSYHFYARGKPDPVITPDPAYLGLSHCAEDRKQQYTKFVVNDEIINKERLAKFPIVGSKEFVLNYLRDFSLRCA